MRNSLFQPLAIGAIKLPNRVVMAPMTRSRANDDGLVGPLTAAYYAQRASAGLILTEGIFPSPMGKGYVRTPGIHSTAQIATWRAVTDAVHAANGRVFAQIMHAGRISDPAFLPGGALPVAPSAIRPNGASYTDTGMRPHVEPRALTTDEVGAVITEYAIATRNALHAGFDGVELHAGTGYLPMQFLSSSTNRRDDRYGGSLDNRLRFVLQTIDAMISIAGDHRVGVKLTPEMPMNDISDAFPVTTYSALAYALAKRKLAFVDVAAYGKHVDYHAILRPLLHGTVYMAGGGLTPESAETMVAEGRADAAVFGQLFIANPDLPHRLRRGAALARADAGTFYAGGARGYTDYAMLEALTA